MKMSVSIGGIVTSADQDRLKTDLKKTLGITYDSLDLSFKGAKINNRPTVVACVPSNHVEVLKHAFRESLGAFSTINISPEKAAAVA